MSLQVSSFLLKQNKINMFILWSNLFLWSRPLLHKHHILPNQDEYPNQNDFIQKNVDSLTPRVTRWHKWAGENHWHHATSLSPRVVAAHDWCWHPASLLLCCSCPVVVLLLLLTTTLASTSQHLDNWPPDHLQRQNWHQHCKCIS